MNRFFFICILTTLALFTSSKVKAQFDVHFNQYWDLKGFYNPAWAGQTDKLNIAGTYSMQMMGFTHSPRTMYFGADMPFSLFNKKMEQERDFLVMRSVFFAPACLAAIFL